MSGRTEHPCKGMTKAQIAAFEAFAVGMFPFGANHPKTIAALAERGLIERGADEVVGRDAFGTITVPTYFVPIAVHAQWCEWCAEQPETPAQIASQPDRSGE
jgi:hypothetical protein